MHNSMQLESMFDNKNKGQKNERKKCPPFANKKPKYLMCHASLDGGMNCVGYDKFPVLSNGIKKKKEKEKKKRKKTTKRTMLYCDFSKTVCYSSADSSEKLHGLQENEQL